MLNAIYLGSLKYYISHTSNDIIYQTQASAVSETHNDCHNDKWNSRH